MSVMVRRFEINPPGLAQRFALRASYWLWALAVGRFHIVGLAADLKKGLRGERLDADNRGFDL